MPSLSARRFFVRETLQASAMDCGPAALHSMLDSLGMEIPYARIRELCNTDVDGTSIDGLIAVSSGLGFVSEELLLPADHLISSPAIPLPLIAVTRTTRGESHFVVVWRRHGDWLQVMDPAVGRRWLRSVELVDSMHEHSVVVPAGGWRKHGVTLALKAGIAHNLHRADINQAAQSQLFAEADADSTWLSWGCLDASARWIRQLTDSRIVARGGDAMVQLHHCMHALTGGDRAVVPLGCWTVTPVTNAPAGAPLQLKLRGSIAITFAEPEEGKVPDAKPIRPRLRRRLEQLKSPAPQDRTGWAALQRLFVGEGRTGMRLVLIGAVLSALTVALEMPLLRRLYDVSIYLGVYRQRVGLMGAFFAWTVAAFLIEVQSSATIARLGRRLEGRMRVLVLERLPLLPESFFKSRLVSDLAQRAHGTHAIRRLPTLLGEIARRVCDLAFTTIGLLLIAPKGAFWTLLAGGASVVVPLLSQERIAEREFRHQMHNGALSRHYLDALLGLIPVRTHGAQRTIRREYNKGLVGWFESGVSLARTAVRWEAGQLAVTYMLAAAIVASQVGEGDQVFAGSFLLVAYWALQLPTLGQDLIGQLRALAPLRSSFVRLLDLTEEEPSELASLPTRLNLHTLSEGSEGAKKRPSGVRIDFENVGVRGGGREILRAVNLHIPAGTHVAIVGLSGAGKSTLLGLLQGWSEASEGRVLVDGAQLEGTTLTALRQQTAWVDPAIQLWNRTLLENLLYGADAQPKVPVGRLLEEAELVGLIERLEGGLQAPLGDGGGMVSGGEGQRVRYGRALERNDCALVLLDEAFRGLDRDRRAAMLRRARHWWRHATVMCVTHDVGETLEFGRIVVIEDGMVIEDGDPAVLHKNPNSRYSQLLRAEQALRDGLWRSREWRRMVVRSGRLQEADQRAAGPERE